VALTPRERAVLQLLGQRLTNEEIASRLVIALPTVKRHTSSIYDKLNVQSRHEAVTRAHAYGLLAGSAAAKANPRMSSML
jgi:LuxR family maltose regulon positive regulatory protein